MLLSFTILFCLGATLVKAEAPTTPPTDSVSNRPTDSVSNNTSFKIKNPFRVGDTLYDLVEAIVNKIILPIGGVLSVLAFIYSGFLYVMAQGNETKLKTAHTALLYTVIGTAILLGSWVLANLIRATVNQVIS